MSLPSVRELREGARALMRLHHSNIMMSALRPGRRRASSLANEGARGKALRDAHRWLDELLVDPTQTIELLAIREGKSERSIRMTLSLCVAAAGPLRDAIGPVAATRVRPGRVELPRVVPAVRARDESVRASRASDRTRRRRPFRHPASCRRCLSRGYPRARREPAWSGVRAFRKRLRRCPSLAFSSPSPGSCSSCFCS